MKVARLIIISILINFNCQASSLIDPMKPKTLAPVKLENEEGALPHNNKSAKYTLKLIAKIDDERICVINGHTLYVGDNIDEYEVAEITRNSVILKNNLRKTIILTIY